jgi:nitroreductase
MCRSFESEPVSSDVLDRVLAAAFRAPAAGNTWGLDLVVLRGDETRAYWGVTLPDPEGFTWPGLLRAPVLAIPVVDPPAYVTRYAAPDKAASGLGAGTHAWDVPYWWVDGGAAVMAMLLAAEDEGLGALFFGQFEHEPRVAARLGIPEGRRALGTIALGWSDEDGRRPSRSAERGRPDPRDFTHHGEWSAG